MSKDIEETVRIMTDFVNNNSCSNNEFAELMGREHRTLQQNFTKLCIAWFVHLSKVKEGWYDLRNEASVKLGKEFVKKIENLYLPFI